MLPLGGGACAGGGSLAPAEGVAGHTYVYGTQVLAEGSTILILADVEAGSTDYESVQEWPSTNGGQSFAPVNGGQAVASGNPSADTQSLNAVDLPGGVYLGYGFDTSAEAPSFHAFSRTEPTLCGRETFPATNCEDGYASLEPSTDEDQVSNAPANFASNDDGVLGVFRTNYSSGNLGCPGASPFGMAFVFGDGEQSPSNDYNVSPGEADTAWRTRVTLADCGVDYLAAGGGPRGFGVIEDNQVTGQTQYHRFDGTNNSFDPAPVVVSAKGEQQPSVSQDIAGGVYATYLSGGIGGPVSLSYSFDGGITWSGPGTLAADPLGSIAGLTSTVNASGLGWAAWTEDGSVFLQPFTSADSVPPPAPTSLITSQKAAGQTGPSLSVPAGTTGETDQATISGANAARATGTLAYTLYSDPSCKASSAIASSTVAVGGALAPASAPVATDLAPGTYYWQAVYSGNQGSIQGQVGNSPSTSPCGSEVLTITSPVTLAASATSNGKTLTFSAACANVPCSLGATATTPAKLAMSGSPRGKAKPKKPVTLGKGKFKLKKKGPQKLTLKLSGAGRKYLAGKRKAKVSLAVTEKIGSQNVVTTQTLNVKVSPPKRKKK